MDKGTELHDSIKNLKKFIAQNEAMVKDSTMPGFVFFLSLIRKTKEQTDKALSDLTSSPQSAEALGLSAVKLITVKNTVENILAFITNAPKHKAGLEAKLSMKEKELSVYKKHKSVSKRKGG